MRLPWGRLDDIARLFLRELDYIILGCLSFEERCCAAPEALAGARCVQTELLEIYDPPNAFPNYAIETKDKIEANRHRLVEVGVPFASSEMELLATADQLLDVLATKISVGRARTIVLDMTSLPKRYFCFLLKRLLRFESFENVIVTYAQPASNGYTTQRLAEDPMTCDHLPGFAAPLPPQGGTLVVSVGFESLSIRSLLEIYHDKKKDVRIVLSFPSDLGSIRREWATLREMISETSYEIARDNIEVIAAWDTEEVYQVLQQWADASDGLTLAPFGPKPHSLGMALFATKYDCGLYYTQPKSYNPDYSRGRGAIWAYVAKWNGIACFDRATFPA